MAALVSSSLIAVLLCLGKGPVTGAIDLDKDLSPGAFDLDKELLPGAFDLDKELLPGPIDLDKELFPAAKPGMCPRNKLDVLGLCAEMCFRDSDCPNNEKCCSNGCGHQCVPPYRAEKPGVCPRKSGYGVCAEMCSYDSDCPNTEKCCSNGCGHECMPPYRAEKPGMCPRRKLGFGVCADLCSFDSDCPKDQKCCRTRCGRECTRPYRDIAPTCPVTTMMMMIFTICFHKPPDSPTEYHLSVFSTVRSQVERMAAPVSSLLIAVMLCLSKGPVTGAFDLDEVLLPEVKPGKCPENNLDEVGFCAEMCFQDSDCRNNEKCCSNGCGHECMLPYRAEKPGVCPKSTLGFGVCAEMCSYDSDCPNDEKCCSNGCGHQCMTVFEEKPGVCPEKLLREQSCDKLCGNDTDCPKDEKCCSTRCGRKCAFPNDLLE
ncbi:uncharacterized protein [Garra rufa]|uniref:uncharacterized protein n=1 Tax=Garra rufa TaxID=137080 RepID=UPI003CCE60F9